MLYRHGPTRRLSADCQVRRHGQGMLLGACTPASRTDAAQFHLRRIRIRLKATRACAVSLHACRWVARSLHSAAEACGKLAAIAGCTAGEDDALQGAVRRRRAAALPQEQARSCRHSLVASRGFPTRRARQASRRSSIVCELRLKEPWPLALIFYWSLSLPGMAWASQSRVTVSS